MTVYAVVIIKKVFNSEYIDSIFAHKESALLHCEELNEQLGEEFVVEVEPFEINENRNDFDA